MFFEALAATVLSFLLFLCLTAIGERIYEQCKKAEEEANGKNMPPQDETLKTKTEENKETKKK